MKSRHNKRGFDRTARVSDLIQKALAKIIQDTSDPRFPLVTITNVVVSKDLSYAKVYISLLVDDELKIKHAVDALNREAKSFRYQLAREVKLRIIPELKFVYDAASAHGFHISSLIDSAMKKTDK